MNFNLKAILNLNRKYENLGHLSSKGNVYELKCEDLNVEMIYSKSNKRIDECILDILKQKIGK